MNVLNLILHDKPIGKQRSRKGRAGNWYNPQANIMQVMKNEIKKQLPENFVMIDQHVPVIVNITWFFKPNKSESTKKFLDLIKNEDYAYTKKPDRDNNDKFVLDLMSKIIMYDDNQVYGGSLYKFYTPNNPRTEIEIIW
jgi:Holliday junction resolvase RusA-like endonuclease